MSTWRRGGCCPGGGGGGEGGPLVIVDIDDDAYTTVPADWNSSTLLRMTSFHDNVVTLDAGSDVDIGNYVYVQMYGIGQTSVVAIGGSILLPSGGKTNIGNRYGIVAIVKVDVHEFTMEGDLV